ncbi:MAG: hypothetical protein ACRDZN_14700 [Acidimicrobiales bacterium]
MASLKPGSRWRSVVCATEVVVVRSPGDDLDLRCGGSPMVPVDHGAVPVGAPAPGLDGGTLLGKRYIDDAGSLELLCTKAGDGSLSLRDKALDMKGSKPLPSSD